MGGGIKWCWSVYIGKRLTGGQDQTISVVYETGSQRHHALPGLEIKKSTIAF